MYCVFSPDCDERFPDFYLENRDWFSVEGDLDDFIFFDPTGGSPEPSNK